MINGLQKAGQDARAMFVNFSDILKMDVLYSNGKLLGCVWDISVKSSEVYPKSDELVIRRGFFRRSYASVPWAAVARMDDDIILDKKYEELKFAPSPKDYEFLLRRDILDQQVVDTYDHKVRRVNDVHLLKVDHELMIAHVDIGLRAIFRRLGWEKAIDILVKLTAGDSAYLTRDEIVSWKYIQPVSVNPASMTMKLSVSEKQISSIPPADLGDIIFDLDLKERMALFMTLDMKTKARTFENLEFKEQEAMLRELDKKEAAQVITYMSSDEATDLLEKLPRDVVENLLVLMESGRAKKLSTLLGYSSDSAGGLMTTELVSLPETMSVEAAIQHVKNDTREFDVVPYMYVVDDKNRLKGVTTVRRLLFADSKELVSKTVFPKTVYVYLNDSVKEVAYLMDKYKTSAIPVVDENKALQGIITMDDILGQVISIAWRKRQYKPRGL